MKNKIIVSIFPTYLCNNNCEFCYLNNHHGESILDLNTLKQRLKQISQYFEIEKFNLYGGEITLLPNTYLKELNDILIQYKCKNYLTTNFYDISKLHIFKNTFFSTSLNEERPDYDYIKSILKKGVNLENLTVLSIVSPSLIRKTPKDALDGYNGLNIQWVSFVKYYPSINTGDVYKITQDQYENFLINILTYYTSHEKDFDYKLCLENGLKSCLNRTYPIATNDQCIRISPDGKFGAVYYTNDNLEYFKWYDDVESYIADAKKERMEYIKRCGNCKYYGNCWTEHLTKIKCDGCKNLLKVAEDIENERW